MKTMNPYAALLEAELYARTPKAVLAAIAVSALTRGDPFNTEELGGDPAALLLAEWFALYENGIVSQKPPGAYVPGTAR